MKIKRGFTLIELLVVIAIIALLLSVILPSLQKAKQSAQTVICKSNLRQWGVVFDMYLQDNDYMFQRGWGGTTRDSNWWMDSALTYYDNVDEIRYCPTATKLRFLENGDPGPGEGRRPFMAWGHRTGFLNPETDHGSYGINGWLEDNQNPDTTPERAECFWRKVTSITNLNNVPVLTDAQWIDAWPEPIDLPLQQSDEDWRLNSGSANNMGRVLQDRHNKRQNVVFADMSVETIGLKKLWRFKWHKEFDTGGIWTTTGGRTPDWLTQAPWMAGYKEY
jgi:prepilin-type N-terminal cleavage/methylation domain-containing protein